MERHQKVFNSFATLRDIEVPVSNTQRDEKNEWDMEERKKESPVKSVKMMSARRTMTFN